MLDLVEASIVKVQRDSCDEEIWDHPDNNHLQQAIEHVTCGNSEEYSCGEILGSEGKETSVQED